MPLTTAARPRARGRGRDGNDLGMEASTSTGDSVTSVRGADVELAVETWGDPARPTVVLVHGWPDTHELWRPTAEHLADRFHVVAYDVRGAGASDHPTDRGAYAIDHLVADLGAVIEATSDAEPVHLVGHDWGGVQGWEAVSDPRLSRRIATFTVISGPSLDHAGLAIRDLARGSWGDRMRLADQVLRFSYILTFVTPMPWLARRIAPGSRLARTVRGTVALALRLAEGHEPDASHPAAGVAVDAAHGTAMYLTNIPDRLRRPRRRHVTVPVQMIEATRDPVVRRTALEASVPWVDDLRRHKLPGGHWLVRTHHREIAGLVAEFIDDLDGVDS